MPDIPVIDGVFPHRKTGARRSPLNHDDINVLGLLGNLSNQVEDERFGNIHKADAAEILSRTRRGVTGVSFTSTPKSPSASLTALAMAAGGGMAPPSPSPFTPYSVSGEGVTRWSSRNLGRCVDPAWCNLQTSRIKVARRRRSGIPHTKPCRRLATRRR